MAVNDAAMDLEEGSDFRRQLASALTIADDLIESLDKKSSSGYILLGKAKPGQDEEQLYDEFHPILFTQHRERPHKEFPSFVKALDDFFSNIEGQRAVQRAQAQEDAAHAKLEGIKAEQMGRVEALSQAEVHNRHLAAAIEANLELVDQVIMVLRSLVATSMDWKELADLVREEARRGNYLAMRVASLNLHINSATLTLPDPHAIQETQALSDSDDSDNEEAVSDAALLKVDIDLGLSAHANASRYYHLKKASTAKKDKTLAVAETAFRNAERKVQQDLDLAKQNKPHVGVSRMRKPFWFEKFMWFVSSEGFLVIAGRDLQQNELIVKKYMVKGDLYVHADMHGAATVVIKNPRGGAVPPSTLNQAGTLSICQSRAWDAKILTSAWWVFHNQVSKTAPTGEFLTAGSFIIRGRKNFLAPAALTYGFGLMYLLDSPSAARRLQARLRREQEHPEASLENIDPSGDIKDDQDVRLDRPETREDLSESGQEEVSQGQPEPPVAEQQTVDKYGLLPSDQLQEQPNSDSDSDEDCAQDINPKESKKYVSAKERRAKKKGGASGTKPTESSKTESGTSSAPLPRGQKARRKKFSKSMLTKMKMKGRKGWLSLDRVVHHSPRAKRPRSRLNKSGFVNKMQSRSRIHFLLLNKPRKLSMPLQLTFLKNPHTKKTLMRFDSSWKKRMLSS
ncbi:hypothetical protein DSO57_1028792 [Entomophthora muscae]|uniref:Uncharacterized protein n=1 Tax=Entomophthora muscae TaxID=34485 RepID=A0ACC2UMA1_9FUNG|nr:hypothetical protein DSO57_1028792 [Entomophthora muscae]